jgi:Holliday junction DNA helicase RuvA
MYHYIKGLLVSKDPTQAVIEAHGVGYELKISLNTHAQLLPGQEAKLFCWLQVKDDAHVLYGFSDLAERQLFLELTSVSGVGPATAIVMLSSLPVADLRQAIASGNAKTVQAIKGIGAKTAQRIILELQDKMAKAGVPVQPTASGTSSAVKTDALEALVALGLPKTTAEKSVEAVLKKKPDASVEEIIRQALRT